MKLKCVIWFWDKIDKIKCSDKIYVVISIVRIALREYPHLFNVSGSYDSSTDLIINLAILLTIYNENLRGNKAI